MQNATINVRLPQSLKQSGDRVLERAGISTSEIVRDLYRYMEREQEVPLLTEIEKQEAEEAEIERKRRLMRSLVGIIPADIDRDAMKWERLQRQIQPGVRV